METIKYYTGIVVNFAGNCVDNFFSIVANFISNKDIRDKHHWHGKKINKVCHIIQEEILEEIKNINKKIDNLSLMEEKELNFSTSEESNRLMAENKLLETKINNFLNLQNEMSEGFDINTTGRKDGLN